MSNEQYIKTSERLLVFIILPLLISIILLAGFINKWIILLAFPLPLLHLLIMHQLEKKYKRKGS